MPKPNPTAENPAPAPSVPSKAAKSAKRPGSRTSTTTNGSTRPAIHSGCVHVCIFATAPMPYGAKGSTISVASR